MKVQTPGYMTVPKVKVKVENIDANSDDEADEDEDDNENNDDRSDEKNQAKRIYTHSLKVLKFKLYFEDFFPTDDDRSALVYDCWMAGAKATKGVNKDNDALKRMLYHFKYDKKVRKLPAIPQPPAVNSCLVGEKNQQHTGQFCLQVRQLP